MKTVTIPVYQFSELSEKARERAAELLRNHTADHHWWDATYDDADNIATLLGITIDRASVLTKSGRRESGLPDIQFSGFWSQGDGASFVGSFSSKGGCDTAIRSYAPLDEKLLAIARSLDTLHTQLSNRLSATLTRRRDAYHHYSHENTVDINVMLTDSHGDERTASAEVEDELGNVLRSFMRWIYGQLESEYDHLTSDDYLAEYANENGYWFDDRGHESSRFLSAQH
ncbi:MAG: hypothetical protein EAZ30_02740 [Betaproteobacteria bacterium]|nr:MAG: hypothetical protein EAZ30_02740 [Betaproteobacteria bacterium]